MIKMAKKDRIELSVTIILVLSFIALLIAFSQRIKGKNQMPECISPGMFSERECFKSDARRNQGAAFILDKNYGGLTGIKRDPFSFGFLDSNQESAASELFLKGIVWNMDNPSAVINDRILSVGEIISGYRITQILEDSVVLEKENSKLNLKLKQN